MLNLHSSNSINLHEKDMKLDIMKENAGDDEEEEDQTSEDIEEKESYDDELDEIEKELNEKYQRKNKIKEIEPIDEYKLVSRLWTISLAFLISITVLICVVLILISLVLHLNIENKKQAKTTPSASAAAVTDLFDSSEDKSSIILETLTTISNSKLLVTATTNANSKIKKSLPIWQICVCILLTIFGFILLYLLRKFCCQVEQSRN